MIKFSFTNHHSGCCVENGLEGLEMVAQEPPEVSW